MLELHVIRHTGVAITAHSIVFLDHTHPSIISNRRQLPQQVAEVVGGADPSPVTGCHLSISKHHGASCVFSESLPPHVPRSQYGAVVPPPPAQLIQLAAE